MVCIYCGVETDRMEYHATQQQCRQALRQKVTHLAREVRELQEMILEVPAAAGKTYLGKRDELALFKNRLLLVNELLDAIEVAKRVGTRNAWERAVRAIEAWLPTVHACRAFQDPGPCRAES